MSKDVNVNGIDYSGVSEVQLNTTDGGTALFKDVDEIVTPSGSVSITENGTYDVSDYASAVVNVSAIGENQLKAFLEGDTTTMHDETITKLRAGIFAEKDSTFTVISLPNCEAVGASCFCGTGLTKVKIKGGSYPNGGIGASSFVRATALHTVVITCDEVCYTAAANIWTGCTLMLDGTGYVYVPSAQIEAYQANSQWAAWVEKGLQFRAIEDYPDEVNF